MDFSPLSPSLRALLAVLFRRMWSIVTVVVVTLAAALFYLLVIRDDAYVVTAKVLVKLGPEQALPSTVLGLPPPVTGQRGQDVNSEVDILVSEGLVARVVDILHLDVPSPPPPPPSGLLPRLRYAAKAVSRRLKDSVNEVLIAVGFRERLGPRETAIYYLQRGLLAEAQRDSNIVVVSLALPFRKEGSVILNTLLEEYQKFRLGLFRDPAAVPFFRAELRAAEDELKRAEEDFQRFEAEGDITALEKQKEVVLSEIGLARSRRDEVRIAHDALAAKVRRLEQERAKAEPDFASLGAFELDSFPQKLQVQLAELQRQREQLRMTDLEDGVRIQNNRRQSASLLALLGSNLESTLRERTSELAAREADLASREARLAGLQQREMGWTARKRKSQALEETYLRYRQKLEEASANATLSEQHLGNVVVVQPATDALVPAGMRKLTMLEIAAVVALLLAFAWVSLAEFFDDRVYTADSLEARLATPVTGAIPREASLPEAPSEAYRTVALLLSIAARNNTYRSVVFASSLQGEGTTTAVVSVGLHLARNHGMEPLIVELNSIRPTLVERFRLDPSRTLEAVGAGAVSLKECLQRVDGGLTLLPAAPPHRLEPGPNPPVARLLSRVLDELARDFPIVLVDVPPVSEAPTALEAGELVPRLVLVVESGRSQFRTLARVRQLLAGVNVAVEQVVLTKHRREVPKWMDRWLTS
jgi:uncharacterized protein involved in exopolysaccharide biosynthesis/Mrp family chromosome partitioning ATPase